MSSEVAYLAEGANEVGGHWCLLGACQVVHELQICHFLIAGWACSKVSACRWTCDNCHELRAATPSRLGKMNCLPECGKKEPVQRSRSKGPLLVFTAATLLNRACRLPPTSPASSTLQGLLLILSPNISPPPRHS